MSHDLLAWEIDGERVHTHPSLPRFLNHVIPPLHNPLLYPISCIYPTTPHLPSNNPPPPIPLDIGISSRGPCRMHPEGSMLSHNDIHARHGEGPNCGTVCSRPESSGGRPPAHVRKIRNGNTSSSCKAIAREWTAPGYKSAGLQTHLTSHNSSCLSRRAIGSIILAQGLPMRFARCARLTARLATPPPPRPQAGLPPGVMKGKKGQRPLPAPNLRPCRDQKTQRG